MADYGAMKVPELKKLLHERGLPQAGNKADLIKRLQEDDDAKATQAGGDSKDGQEEITYDEDDVAAKPVADKAAPATAETAEKPAAPVSAAPAAQTEEKKEVTEPAVATSEDAPPAADDKFAKTMPDLAPTDAKTEAEKRAARAARFGIQPTEDTDEAKHLKRQERFGLAKDQISALDSALPDRPAKRGRERNDDGNRNNKRGRDQGRNQGRGGNGGGRNNRQGGRDGRDGGDRRQAKSMGEDAVEKKKMEERAKRFAS